MKKVTLKTSLMALFFFASTISFGQDVDLQPGINYGYDPADAQGIITISEVNACNNGSGDASAFDLSMYLYDESSQLAYFIGTTRYTMGLSGNSCRAFQNWTIDINNTSGVPAGTYRLGVYLDYDDEIAETDENNNAGLLSGDNFYTPSTSSLTENKVEVSNVSTYPNPASDYINVRFSVKKETTLKVAIYDVNGREVLTMNDENLQNGVYLQKLDVSQLKEGIYSLIIQTDEQSLVRKIDVIK